MLSLGNGVDLLDFKTFRVDDRFAFGGLLLSNFLGGARQDDVLDLYLHRAPGVELYRQYARERTLGLLLVHNLTGGDAVDFVGENISPRL
ncbi:MAG: hypothetical protein MK312_08455, partial [Roseibacillus sp.]|nr:hypothetical protein [Roseibacillus sp.]